MDHSENSQFLLMYSLLHIKYMYVKFHLLTLLCSIQTSSPLNLGKNDQLSHDCHNYTNSSVDSDLEIISLSVTFTSFHNNNYINNDLP